jgi:hypothetical protein
MQQWKKNLMMDHVSVKLPFVATCVCMKVLIGGSIKKGWFLVLV